MLWISEISKEQNAKKKCSFSLCLGLVQKTQVSLWTGLNKLDVSSGWQWSNGQPLRYLKWLSGKTLFQSKDSVLLNPCRAQYQQH